MVSSLENGSPDARQKHLTGVHAAAQQEKTR
jgi:hypothetical protein